MQLEPQGRGKMSIYRDKRTRASKVGIRIHQESTKDITKLKEISVREFIELVQSLEQERDLINLAGEIYIRVLAGFDATNAGRVLRKADEVADLVIENGPAIDSVDNSKQEIFREWLYCVSAYFRLINVYNYKIDSGLNVYL